MFFQYSKNKTKSTVGLLILTLAIRWYNFNIGYVILTFSFNVKELKLLL